MKLLGSRRVVGTGLLFDFLSMTVYAIAPDGTWFWLGVPLMALASLSGPPLQAMMTREVSASEQGQLQGTSNSAKRLSAIAGPGIFAASFAALMGTLPSAPFLAAALLMVVAMGVALLLIAAPTVPSREENA